MEKPNTYALLHGAWCWKHVACSLRTRGHEVYLPNHTGVGERSHLMSREITLEV